MDITGITLFLSIGQSGSGLISKTFFEKLLSRDKVLSVKMFSALVDPHNPISDARERQERYFSALKTFPKVQIILGAFQPVKLLAELAAK